MSRFSKGVSGEYKVDNSRRLGLSGMNRSIENLSSDSVSKILRYIIFYIYFTLLQNNSYIHIIPLLPTFLCRHRTPPATRRRMKKYYFQMFISSTPIMVTHLIMPTMFIATEYSINIKNPTACHQNII